MRAASIRPVRSSDDSGPPTAELGRRLRKRGEVAFAAFVRGAGERRLDRTVGSTIGLRVLFAGMTHRFVPERAEGFAGEIQYELRAGEGVRAWVIEIAGERAIARPGRGVAPALTVRTTVADFARIAARELDPTEAVLGGRLALEGDFALAARLGGMFGEPSPS